VSQYTWMNDQPSGMTQKYRRVRSVSHWSRFISDWRMRVPTLAAERSRSSSVTGRHSGIGALFVSFEIVRSTKPPILLTVMRTGALGSPRCARGLSRRRLVWSQITHCCPNMNEMLRYASRSGILRASSLLLFAQR
jgi:hypothetical protein